MTLGNHCSFLFSIRQTVIHIKVLTWVKPFSRKLSMSVLLIIITSTWYNKISRMTAYALFSQGECIMYASVFWTASFFKTINSFISRLSLLKKTRKKSNKFLYTRSCKNPLPKFGVYNSTSKSQIFILGPSFIARWDLLQTLWPNKRETKTATVLPTGSPRPVNASLSV